MTPNVDLPGQQLPGATAGQAYSAQIQISGGTAPYAFTVAQGIVPPGLSVSPTGLVSGVPTQQQNEPVTSRFYATAVDSSSPQQSTQSGYEAYVDVIVTPPGYQPPPPLQITTAALPDAEVGQPYSFTMHASGGTPPYSWSSTAELPAGFTMSGSGTITGSSGEEQGTFDVVVVDSGFQQLNDYQWMDTDPTTGTNQSTSAPFTLTVSSGIPTADPALIDFWDVYNTTPGLSSLAENELFALLGELPGGGTPSGLVGYVEQEVINEVCSLTGGPLSRGCLI